MPDGNFQDYVALSQDTLSHRGANLSIGTSSASTLTLGFSNSAGAALLAVAHTANETVWLPNAGGAVTLAAGSQLLAVAAGTQTATSGTAVLSNSNGMTFGMSNSSVITGSFNSTVSNQIAAGTQTGAQGSTIVLSNSNNVSFGMSNSSVVTATASYNSTSTNLIAAGTQTGAANSTIVFSNSNNVSFGMSNSSVVTASAQVNLSAGTTSTNASAWTYSNSNNVSFGLNGATVTASASVPVLSFFMPPLLGGVSTGNVLVNNTVYFQPFVADAAITAFRYQNFQSMTQATSTISYSLSVSSSFTSSYTGSMGQFQTLLLLSRKSTGTNANSSVLLTFFSTTASLGFGMTVSLSNSTNVSSATMTVSTSALVSYIQNIGSNGAYTSSTAGTSGTTSFSSTTTNSSTFSTSFQQTQFYSSYVSGMRPFWAGMATSLSMGEYWLGIQQSTTSSSLSLLSFYAEPIIATSLVSQYLEYGLSGTVQSSNYLMQGWGSANVSGSTTTTIALSSISNVSNQQTVFAMMAATR